MSCVTMMIVLPMSFWQSQEFVLELAPDHRVDSAERFVHQHEGRVRGEGARDPHSLLLATRELPRIPVREVRRETDRLEQLHRPGSGLLLRLSQQSRHRRDVVHDSAVREQSGVLDDVPDPPAQQRRIHVRRRFAVEGDGSGGRFDQSVDHAKRRGLAASRRPDECCDLPARALEVQFVHRCRAVRVRLGDFVECDHSRATFV